MSVNEYLSAQTPERREIMSAIHEMIVGSDKKAEAKVGKMMGIEMILYTTGGVFKYGLASVKKYMSLHAMPIYASSPLHSKYSALLKDAKFQKGCINFTGKDDMPLEIVADLIKDCALVDLRAIMENLKKNRGA